MEKKVKKPIVSNVFARYQIELAKCLKDEVTVIDDRNVEHTGICLAINPTHLNVVLMTDTEKIIIRNVRIVKRKREVKE